MKINIYWGPRIFFENKTKEEIIDEEFLTLNEYVKILDEKIITIKSENKSEDNKVKKELKNLVCYSDDFLSLSDSGINNFLSILSHYNIKNIFIQNPPNLIKERLQQLNLITEEYSYVYNKLDFEIVESFARDFNNKILGQESARNSLVKALFKKTKTNKPIVIMLFGPSGIGKTETAKYLSNLLNQNLFRTQFSMFQSNSYSDYLFGGTHNQSSFAKDLLDRESNIILLDEFDKTGSYFHSAFYQLFDEGIYVDKNYSVNLKEAIILCTSNYKTLSELKNTLGAPLYYRFDYIIEFKELSSIAKSKIIDLYLNKYFNKLTNYEKDFIKLSTHKTNLNKVINKLKNVRQIKMLIEDLFLEDLIKNQIKNY